MRSFRHRHLNHRSLSIGIVGLVIASLGTACGSAPSTSAADQHGIPAGPINVVGFSSLSGANATYGPIEEKSENAAVAIFNKQGGVDGHPIHIVWYDPKSDPAAALAEARQAAANSGISASPWVDLGATSEAITPYLMTQKVPLIIPDLPDYYLTKQYPTFWTVSPVISSRSTQEVLFAKHLHARKVGILNDGSPIGNDELQHLSTDLKASGIPYAKYSYSPTAVDISSTLREMRSAGVDVIAVASEEGIQTIYSGLTEIGWAPKLILPFVESFTNSASQLANTYAACNTGASSHSYKPNALEMQLLLAQNKLIGVQPVNEEGLVGSYQALLVLKAAILKARSTSRLAIDKALQSLTVSALGTKFTFAPAKHYGFPTSGVGICNLGKTNMVAPFNIPIQVHA